jgi:catechol 2,3-dioxygenase-like lactoylglutathione lyase family enzyme
MLRRVGYTVALVCASFLTGAFIKQSAVTASRSSLRRPPRRPLRCLNIQVVTYILSNGNQRRSDVNELDANADLAEGRQRYFERFAFPLFSHIDFRVSDAQAVRPFYDALMGLFGTEPTTVRSARYGYTRRYGSVRADFFNVYEDPEARPTAMRIAFAAPSTDFVDRVARVVREHGAREIEGPAYFEQAHPTFYGVFFEDPLGNRLEVCHHRMDK